MEGRISEISEIINAFIYLFLKVFFFLTTFWLPFISLHVVLKESEAATVESTFYLISFSIRELDESTHSSDNARLMKGKTQFGTWEQNHVTQLKER